MQRRKGAKTQRLVPTYCQNLLKKLMIKLIGMLRQVTAFLLKTLVMAFYLVGFLGFVRRLRRLRSRNLRQRDRSAINL